MTGCSLSLLRPAPLVFRIVSSAAPCEKNLRVIVASVSLLVLPHEIDDVRRRIFIAARSRSRNLIARPHLLD